MSEYTPTTKGIKSSSTEFNAKHSDEQFDRWLAGVQAEAWKEGYVAGFLKAMGGELDGSAREAATRVPVQGEPNNGQEAIDAEAFKQYPARDNFGVPDLRVFAFKAGAEWAFSRTTVPDAANAAIARVRAIHRPTLPGYGPKACVHDGRGWPCETMAALDGASEPEEKP